jgi:hypothetical protein
MIVTQGYGSGMLVTQGYGAGGVASVIKYITKLFIIPVRQVIFKT